jgi:hypothetical protein
MGQQFFLQLSSEPADRHARPDWFGRMPGRTNRILVTAAGVTHRSQLAYWLRDGGCIDRLQFGVSSKSVNSATTMMTPFHVGNGQRTDGLRDQGLTVVVQNPLGAK